MADEESEHEEREVSAQEILEEELILHPFNMTKSSLYSCLRGYIPDEGAAGDEAAERLTDEIAGACRADELLETIHQLAVKRVGEISQAILDSHAAELDEDSHNFADRFPAPSLPRR